jgi:hypothetical protein
MYLIVDYLPQDFHRLQKVIYTSADAGSLLKKCDFNVRFIHQGYFFLLVEKIDIWINYSVMGAKIYNII